MQGCDVSKLLVFYNKKQVAPVLAEWPNSRKPSLVLQSWREQFDVEVKKVKALSPAQISCAHDPKYVRDILGCRTKNGFGNTLKSIASTLPWTTGSMMSAAVYALQNQCNTFSPTSGFHHAGYAHASGLCTFSGLTITGILLKNNYGAKNVGILDLDSHLGDGTLATLARTGADSFISHYSLGEEDIHPENNVRWLAGLAERIRSLYSSCSVLLYQAGVDCHQDDPLVDSGHFTDEQIYQRDRIVYETCRELSLPVVTNLAGGYQKPLDKVLRLHDLCAKAHLDVLSALSGTAA